MYHDFWHVVIILFANSETLAPCQVFFLANDWKGRRSSFIQDALLSSKISAFYDTAALRFFDVFKGAVWWEIFSRFSFDFWLAHNFTDLFRVIFLFPLNRVFKLSNKIVFIIDGLVGEIQFFM